MRARTSGGGAGRASGPWMMSPGCGQMAELGSTELGVFLGRCGHPLRGSGLTGSS